jgi:hypothetical protein
MAGYTLIGSDSVVQVLSPTVTQDSVVATIQTSPTGVVATTVVSQAAFDNNSAAEELTALADNIEELIAQGKATGGSGTSSLDSSGLTVYYVTFTVGYNPPNAPTGTVTVDVDVPVNLLTVSDPEINTTLLAEAEKLIDNAYNSLVALSGG